MAATRFDDIDGLKKLVSAEFGPFGPRRRITQAMVNQFAELTGDRQWIHVDVDRAKGESPFGGPIVHGFFVLSLIAGLPSGSFPELSGAKASINYGADKLRFILPVPCDSEVHIRHRLVDAEQKPSGTLLTHESEIHVVGAPKPSVVYRHLQLLA
jgi:acyl dehydratase